jgi:CCR4-NOT transcription complex subunit 9
MLPNSHLQQYLQQPSLNGASNPLINLLQSNNNNAGTNNNNGNMLSQHFPAMNRANPPDPYAYAQMMNPPPPQVMNPNYGLQEQQQKKMAQQLNEDKIYSLVPDLLNLSTREQALLDLSKKREQYEDLAVVLWYSYGKWFIYHIKSLCLYSSIYKYIYTRCYSRIASRDYYCLSTLNTSYSQWRCF